MTDNFIVGCLVYRKPKHDDFHIYYYKIMKELWSNRYNDDISIYIVALHYLDARDGLPALVNFCRENNRKLYVDPHTCSEETCPHNTKLLIIVDNENRSNEIKNIIPQFTISEIIITQDQYNDMINNIRQAPLVLERTSKMFVPKNKHNPTYEDKDVIWSDKNKRLESIYGDFYLTVEKRRCIIM